MRLLTEVSSSWFDHGVYLHTKAEQLPSSIHLLPRILEAVKVVEVLYHTPCHRHFGLDSGFDLGSGSAGDDVEFLLINLQADGRHQTFFPYTLAPNLNTKGIHIQT